ncbi:hypothetical protein OHR68_09120 [Spirillospora sp. NBC_00431]
MSEIARRGLDLAPLSPELRPEVTAWAGELRSLFAALNVSIGLFSRLHPIDKGTVSRYLNGKRVPTDRWFLDQILAMRASAGEPVTDEVHEHLIKLQMNALQTAHPHEYRVRKVSDELEIAVTSWREAERYAQALEQQLNERTRSYEGLLKETEHLRSAWDSDRLQHDQEIADLTVRLKRANDRARRAEQRVQVMEDLLDRLESRDSAGSGLIDSTPTDPRALTSLLDSLRRVGADSQLARVTEDVNLLSLDLGDVYAVTGLLDALRRINAHTQISELVERIPEVPLHPGDLYGLAGLLDALRRVEAHAQIDLLLTRVPSLRINSLYHAIRLLGALRRANAKEQIDFLVEKILHLSKELTEPAPLTEALEALRQVGAQQQIDIIVRNSATDVSLRHPGAIANLLRILQRVGAREQSLLLARRVAHETRIDDGSSIEYLLGAFWEIQALKEGGLLAHRARISDWTSKYR